MGKYCYEVFMKRVQGPDRYYHIDKDKSVRDNLNGKVIIEFPEFIVTTADLAIDYFDKITNQIDYKKGQKPIRPGVATESLGTYFVLKNDCLIFRVLQAGK